MPDIRPWGIRPIGDGKNRSDLSRSITNDMQLSRDVKPRRWIFSDLDRRYGILLHDAKYAFQGKHEHMYDIKNTKIEH